MKIFAIPIVLISMSSVAPANIAPTVVIQSAAMRPGTTLMDVVYRVNDPDDATVKTRVLAFVDGVRSFANVLRPVTFVEGTAANLGDAIPSNTNHTLTWDVGTDWDIELGQVKFEVLALDGRGLLPIDWISIPAAGGQPALTISKDTPSETAVLNALIWQYAAGDPELTLTNGVLSGSATSGVFAGVPLANGTTLQHYSAPFLFKQMNLDPAPSEEVAYANTTARAGLLSLTSWHAVNRAYAGLSIIVGSHYLDFPVGLIDVRSISVGRSHFLALKGDGTVIAWGSNRGNATSVPFGLSGVSAVAAGGYHSLALKSDGTVIAWGARNNGDDDSLDDGQATVPLGLTGVVAIAAGERHSLALKSDGTVVCWGDNEYGQTDSPPDLTNVVAIDAGGGQSMALKGDGTVVDWGYRGLTVVPDNLSGVIMISAGGGPKWALKGDGTLVHWGGYFDATQLDGLTGITSISAGAGHLVARVADGQVVVLGDEYLSLPIGLTGVYGVFAGSDFSMALKIKAP